MRRLLIALLAVAAVTVVLSGCGESGPEGALDEALAYLPKDSALAIAVATDPEGEEIEQLRKLIGRFPGGGQFEQGFRQGIARSGLDYERDIKPLLGNDAVIGIPSVRRNPAGQVPFVAAIKVDDEDKAQGLAGRGAQKVGEKGGADIYRQPSGQFTAVHEGVVVTSSTQPALEQAIDRAGGGDHLTEDDFNAGLGELPKDSLLRIYGDFERLLAGTPGAAEARRVKWVGALRRFGVSIGAEDDGVAIEFNLDTEGDLSDADLPLASGEQSPPVIERAGEVGFGIRDFTRSYRFGEQVGQAANPREFGNYKAQKDRASKLLGVDLDRDVIDQLSGDTSISVSLDGKFASRTGLKDAEAFKATLERLSDRLPDVAERLGGGNVAIAKPSGGEGFYALSDEDGDRIAYGVVNGALVVASDADRAAQFGAQSPSKVEGAEGAAALSLDTQALANEIIKRELEGPESLAGRAFTGPLGDLTGYIRATTDAVRGKFKLKIE